MLPTEEKYKRQGLKTRESKRTYTRWLFESNKHYIRNLLLLYMSLYPVLAFVNNFGLTKPFASFTNPYFWASLPLMIGAYVCTYVDKYIPFIRIIFATALFTISLNISLIYSSISPSNSAIDAYYTAFILTIAMIGLSMSSLHLIITYIGISTLSFLSVSVFVHRLDVSNPHLFLRSSLFVLMASGLFMAAGVIVESFLLKLYKAQKTITQEKEQISDQKDTLENLNETKDRFFNIISHDLRSPFTSLIGYFDLLLRNDGKDFKAKKEDIEKMYLHIRRTYNLLNNLLNWSKTQLNEYVHKPKRYKLAPIFLENRSLYREIANQKGIKIVHAYSDNAMVYCDKEMIATIIRNLVFNAIKFTKPHGEIHLTAKQIGENEMEIAVVDNGIGISDKEIEMVLNPSTHHVTKGTHNEKGSGIGLIICNDILKKHHSKMQIESKKNVGSKFFFILPIYP